MATTTNTLRLKVGGKYKTRDGRAVEIDDSDPSSEWPWVGWLPDEISDDAWRDDGSWEWRRGIESDNDLVSEIQDEAPAYQYFRYRDGSTSDKFYVIWRVAPGSGVVEGKCPNVRDQWTDTYIDLQCDLIDAEDIVECDADGNPLEPAAPEYRYFRWVDEPRTDPYFTIWRFSSADRPIEGKLPNRPGDEWQETSLDLVKDLLSDTNIIECDADGLILGRPEPESAPTGDLTPESRTRIAKLAARIVLADGPVFTVDELTGLTVAELVAKLETITPVIEL